MAIYPDSAEGRRRRSEFNDPLDAQARGLTRFAEGPYASPEQKWNNGGANILDGLLAPFKPTGYSNDKMDALRKTRFAANDQALRNARPNFDNVEGTPAGKDGLLQGDALRKATNKRIWDENADVRAQNGGIDAPGDRTGNENEVLGTFQGRAITRGASDRMAAGGGAGPATGGGLQRRAASTFGMSVLDPRMNDQVAQAPVALEPGQTRGGGRFRGADAMSEQYNSREDREAITKALSDTDSERFRLELVSQHGGGRGRRADAALGGLGQKRADLLALQTGATQNGADRRAKYQDSAADRDSRESQFGRDLGFKQEQLDRSEAWDREKFGQEIGLKRRGADAQGEYLKMLQSDAKAKREDDAYGDGKREQRDAYDEGRVNDFAAAILKANPELDPAMARRQAQQSLSAESMDRGEGMDTGPLATGDLATREDLASTFDEGQGWVSQMFDGEAGVNDDLTYTDPKNFNPNDITIEDRPMGWLPGVDEKRALGPIDPATGMRGRKTMSGAEALALQRRLNRYKGR